MEKLALLFTRTNEGCLKPPYNVHISGIFHEMKYSKHTLVGQACQYSIQAPSIGECCIKWSFPKVGRTHGAGHPAEFFLFLERGLGRIYAQVATALAKTLASFHKSYCLSRKGAASLPCPPPFFEPELPPVASPATIAVLFLDGHRPLSLKKISESTAQHLHLELEALFAPIHVTKKQSLGLTKYAIK